MVVASTHAQWSTKLPRSASVVISAQCASDLGRKFFFLLVAIDARQEETILRHIEAFIEDVKGCVSGATLSCGADHLGGDSYHIRHFPCLGNLLECLYNHVTRAREASCEWIKAVKNDAGGFVRTFITTHHALGKILVRGARRAACRRLIDHVSELLGEFQIPSCGSRLRILNLLVRFQDEVAATCEGARLHIYAFEYSAQRTRGFIGTHGTRVREGNGIRNLIGGKVEAAPDVASLIIG
mmetsp:Transcript_43315/g.73890  ORF Transcript_43315/g.73890 Transcript_43315/m.73890 type:complete len:240 (-) Transcript_43315:427-1146(-)